jgi:beta-lactam-binding protein with PASTA domain
VRRVKSGKPRGRIVKQSPRWGVNRAQGARINLFVSRGKR